MFSCQMENTLNCQLFLVTEIGIGKTKVADLPHGGLHQLWGGADLTRISPFSV